LNLKPEHWYRYIRLLFGGLFVAGAEFEPDGGADEADGGADLVGEKTSLQGATYGTRKRVPFRS